jgi:hypothetical protein
MKSGEFGSSGRQVGDEIWRRRCRILARARALRDPPSPLAKLFVAHLSSSRTSVRAYRQLPPPWPARRSGHPIESGYGPADAASVPPPEDPDPEELLEKNPGHLASKAAQLAGVAPVPPSGPPS